MKLEPILGKPENKRAKGYAILAKGNEPKQIKENVFRVPFQNSEKYYYVTTNKNGKASLPFIIVYFESCHLVLVLKYLQRQILSSYPMYSNFLSM